MDRSAIKERHLQEIYIENCIEIRITITYKQHGQEQQRNETLIYYYILVYQARRCYERNTTVAMNAKGMLQTITVELVKWTLLRAAVFTSTLNFPLSHNQSKSL